MNMDMHLAPFLRINGEPISVVLAVAFGLGAICGSAMAVPVLPSASYTASTGPGQNGSYNTITGNSPADSNSFFRGDSMYASSGLAYIPLTFPNGISQISSGPGSYGGSLHAGEAATYSFTVLAVNPCRSGQTVGCDLPSTTIHFAISESVYSATTDFDIEAQTYASVDGPGASYSFGLDEGNSNFLGHSTLPLVAGKTYTSSVDQPLTVEVGQTYTVQNWSFANLDSAGYLNSYDIIAEIDPQIAIDPNALNGSDYTLYFSQGIGVSPAPEPATISLLGLGLGIVAGMGVVRWPRRRSSASAGSARWKANSLDWTLSSAGHRAAS